MKNLKSILIIFTLFAFSSGSFLFAGEEKTKKPKIKNVIIMIADGCGFNHVNAASLYQYGSTGKQIYETFPVSLAVSTYQVGQGYDPEDAWSFFNYVTAEYTDSSAAATAMACGIKSYDGAIGVSVDGFPVMNVLERAEELGKATGVVTSVPFSHATPASFVAHNPSRDSYAEIANEMIYHSPVDLIMGCGHPEYNSNGSPTTSRDYQYVGGSATWNDLKDGSVTGADADGDGIADNWTVISSRPDFQNLATGSAPKRLIGIPKIRRTLQQERSGNAYAPPFTASFIETVPTLTEMTKAALNVLDDDPDGLFLMIEGGAVDWAAHSNQPGRVIEEQISFNQAVEAVVDWVGKKNNWHDTLLIVTADHETGYLTGPGSGPTEDGPVWNPLINNGAGSQPGMEWHSGGHTNSLVPFYAKGMWSFLFKIRSYSHRPDPVRGRYIDNTDIADIIFTLWKEK